MDTPYEMDNAIAFDLGAFNYPCMWDNAVWTPNREDFKYAYFFNWGTPLESNSVWTFDGHLNEEKFKTLEHKHCYIKGRLSSYSVDIKDDSITVAYANSIRSRDIFVKWVTELIANKFGDKANWDINTEDGVNTIPCTPRLVLDADREIIEWILTGGIN